MKIKVSYITEKNLTSLPEWSGFPYSCKYCLYWECPEKFNAGQKSQKRNLLARKIQWSKNFQNRFGDCGIIIYVDGKSVGYAAYAPPKFLPNLVNYPVFPSPDAILISCLFIFEKKYRRLGFGTVLLSAVLENLENRKFRVIETIARKNNSDNPSGPVDFYLKNEFKIYKDDKEFPLMRLEL